MREGDGGAASDRARGQASLRRGRAKEGLWEESLGMREGRKGGWHGGRVRSCGALYWVI